MSDSMSQEAGQINQNLQPINKDKLLSLSIQEKYSYIENLIIYTPQTQSLLKKIDECYSSGKYMTKPLCMHISGQWGTGKTTFSKLYSVKHPDIQYLSFTKKPVLYCEIPCPAYIGSLPKCMIKSLGDEFYLKGRDIFTQTQRLYDLLHLCQVEIIFLDEVQHLVDRNSQRLIRDSSDWFKMLIDNVKIPIIFTGMPDSKRIFHENEQLGSRVRYHVEINTLEYDIEFRKLLHIFDNQLPFKNLSNLGTKKLSKCIHTATKGVMRTVKDLLLEASNISLYLSLDYIPLNAFAEAFDKILCNTGDNVFR